MGAQTNQKESIMSYIVTWTIDIDAKTPRQAAELAFEIMQDKDSIANSFEVLDPKSGELIEVDIMMDHEEIQN